MGHDSFFPSFECLGSPVEEVCTPVLGKRHQLLPTLEDMKIHYLLLLQVSLITLQLSVNKVARSKRLLCGYCWLQRQTRKMINVTVYCTDQYTQFGSTFSKPRELHIFSMVATQIALNLSWTIITQFPPTHPSASH